MVGVPSPDPARSWVKINILFHQDNLQAVISTLKFLKVLHLVHFRFKVSVFQDFKIEKKPEHLHSES
jgi:hypothetical protein